MACREKAVKGNLKMSGQVKKMVQGLISTLRDGGETVGVVEDDRELRLETLLALERGGGSGSSGKAVSGSGSCWI